jgi:plastocyanin
MMNGLRILAWAFLFLTVCMACQKGRPATDRDNSSKNNDSKAAPHAAAVHVIEIKQMQFVPAETYVKKGDEVRWINKDITNHDVTEQSSKAWASSPLATGESWTMVATETVEYYCNLHMVMKGKIIVE